MPPPSITSTRIMTSNRIVLAPVAAGTLGGAGAALVAGSRAHAAAPVAMAVAPPCNGAVADPTSHRSRSVMALPCVGISVTGMKKTSNDQGDEAPAAQRRGMPGIDPNDPFFEFFKRFQGPSGGFGGEREMPARGRGSGFIIGADGTILTNAHVVRDAKEVIVKLSDRREFQAKVLGADAKTDIAVLKIFKLDKPEGALVFDVDAGSRLARREELTAQLGDASDKKVRVDKAENSAGNGKLGLAPRPLHPQEQREAGIDGGLLVGSASGPAALAGVQTGDLLMGIDGKPVQSVEQVREGVAKSGKSVALLIQRDGNRIFVPVRIG